MESDIRTVILRPAKRTIIIVIQIWNDYLSKVFDPSQSSEQLLNISINLNKCHSQKSEKGFTLSPFAMKFFYGILLLFCLIYVKLKKFRYWFYAVFHFVIQMNFKYLFFCFVGNVNVNNTELDASLLFSYNPKNHSKNLEFES